MSETGFHQNMTGKSAKTIAINAIVCILLCVISEPSAFAQQVPSPAADVDQVAPIPDPLVAPIDVPNVVGQLAPPTAGLGLGLGASLGTTLGSYSAAPAMIGDFFGGTFQFVNSGEMEGGNGSGSGSGQNPGEGDRTQTVSIAGGDRRFKIAENVSPIPRDRLFFNYNHFENALDDYLGRPVSLDRYALGLEKTFFDELTSIEIRLPIAQGLNSTQDFLSSETRGVELSNLSIAFKGVLLSGERWLISGGTTLTLPTGDGYAEAFNDQKFFFIDNDAVHLAPFIGWLVMPSEKWFAQGFFQTDFDLNGNEVRSVFSGSEGILQDQNLLFVDVSVGHWLMRRNPRTHTLSGIAAITELHYTMTMNDPDEVAGVTNPFNHIDVLNLTAALHFQFKATSIRLGAAAPLRENEERLYDAEIIAQWSRHF